MNFKFLRIVRSPTEEVLEILNNNVIGTPGHGMLYQHLRVGDKITRIAAPYFVNLISGTKTIGTCCFCRREFLADGEKQRRRTG